MLSKQQTRVFSILLGIVLVAAVACGTPAATPTPEPVAEPTPAEPAIEPTPTPVAEPAPAVEPPEAATPAGTLNVGKVELGPFRGHPTQSVLPGVNLNISVPVAEGLMRINTDLEVQGWLLESWDISEDSTTWTLKLQEGVQFHKGYGEMTAEDMVWSYAEGWAQNDLHNNVEAFKEFWANPNGYVEAPDRYTVVVNSGTPLSVAALQQEWMIGFSNWIISKRQTEEAGVEEANQDPALTGPWELTEARTGEFWRFQAVTDHWRQTPHFEELVFWELPEESSRLAGFQTGNLDTFDMSFDTIPLVESVPSARLMSVPGGADYTLQIHGNYHAEALAGEPPDGYKPEFPWVSASANVESEEWEKAKKVRQALVMAIDRGVIIETVLGGFARPGIVRTWSNHEHRLGDRRWEYNPDRARELLGEAGYADGFNITLTPAIRNAPGEVELCEAIATMWGNELGLDVRFQRVPYETLRPQMTARNYEGAICHGFSQRVLVVGAPASLTTWGGSSYGATHPFIEERVAEIQVAVDDAKRERLEEEVGRFLFDNAFTAIGLFVGDSVWPVGPRIDEWAEYINARDPRTITGFEYIQPRQ